MGLASPLVDPRRPARGFALILVVITIALSAAIAVFFLANVGRERRGVDLYSRGSDARHLADVSVSLVQGQISAATKEGYFKDSSGATKISWASQPGMIRTYGQDGNLSNAYKLYSWDSNTMVEGSTTFNPNSPSELPSSNWLTSPAVFTDLNQPVNNVYPIADPSIANFYTGTPPTATTTSSVAWDFPSEFAVKKDAGGYTASSNTLPMPVKWLYVLQDGTWSSPGNGTTSVNVPRASTANPIVGRIAFWTDDETSKVNVNTASEGSFWDTPKAATQDELQFAANPPNRGEFQRISGHPATTSLSAVFPELRTGGFSRWNIATGSTNTTYTQELQDLFSLTPRIAWGGSQAGTYPVTSYTQTYPPPTTLSYTSNSVTTDTDRLYASADDLWFLPGRGANTAFTTGSYGLTTAQKMAKRLFLITANSRAPETTLFETPRISLWPVTWPYAQATYYVSTTNGTTRRTNPPAPSTAVDPTKLALNKFMTYQERLLAFCSTLSKDASTPLPFYFQRQNPDSPTYDWTAPALIRNQQLVTYLSNEMNTDIPGMSDHKSLYSKFGTSTDWIALNCFDFSRSLVNQYTYNQTASTSSDYQYAYTGLQVSSGVINGGAASGYTETNAYTVAPLHVPFKGVNYTTEGSFPSLKEVSVVFYGTRRDNIPKPPVDPAADATDPTKWTNLITTTNSQTAQMQAVMLLSFSGMDPGVWSFRGQTFFAPVFWVRVSQVGGESFKVNGTPINMPSSGGDSVQISTLHKWSAYASNVVGQLVAVGGAGASANATKSFNNGASSFGNWSLVSAPYTFVATDDLATFDFTGAKIQVDIFACLNGDVTQDPTQPGQHPELLISSQQIDFSQWNSTNAIYPSRRMPIPLIPRWNVRQATSIKMPTLGHMNTDKPAVAGWASEIVPFIGQQSQLNPTLSQTGASSANYYDPRAVNYTPDSTSVTALAEPLIYAYQGVDAGGTAVPISTSFASRVNANRNSPKYVAEGTAPGSDIGLFGGSQPTTPIQGYQIITPYDTAISMVRDPRTTSAGDPRLMGRGINTSSGDANSTEFVRIDVATNSPWNSSIAPLANIVATPLRVIYDSTNTLVNSPRYARNTSQWQYHSLSTGAGFRFPTGYFMRYQYANPTPVANNTALPLSPLYLATRGLFTQSSGTGAAGYLLGRDVWDAVVGVDTNVTNILYSKWDFTSLPGNFADGGYVCRPDQDYQILSTGGINGLRVPYFNDAGLATTVNGGNLSLNVFMPNRQIPSPIVLGTLPSSLTTGWQTLCFSPNPAATMNGAGTHPGPGVAASTISAGAKVYTAVPDHLLLDLFWMPVAEPYPISDQMSTAGKVNLNYAMMPFPYIERRSGLDAVMKSVWLTALPTPTAMTSAASPTFAQLYKSYSMLYQKGRLDQTNTRFPVNVGETLKAFDFKFAKGDIFRSASQICDMFLYPNQHDLNDQMPTSALVAETPPSAGASAYPSNAISAWWATKRLTADNSREDPYSAIYSRITTKSNTFTVHWKVQVLRKRPTTNHAEAGTWDEVKDAVGSELRGSTLIERYLDPNAFVPDYAQDINAKPLTEFYKWRVVSDTYFHP